MKTLIKDIQLVDFKNVSATSMCILINEQGIIEELSPVLPSNEIDYQIIEGENRYALPGLINLHAHLFGSGAPLNVPENIILKKLVTHLLTTRFGKNRLRSVMQRNAEVELQSGVTTIRTLGETCYQDIVLRNQISKGEVIGPNLVVSGPMLSAKGGHGTPFVATENQSSGTYVITEATGNVEMGNGSDALDDYLEENDYSTLSDYDEQVQDIVDYVNENS